MAFHYSRQQTTPERGAHAATSQFTSDAKKIANLNSARSSVFSLCSIRSSHGAPRYRAFAFPRFFGPYLLDAALGNSICSNISFQPRMQSSLYQTPPPDFFLCGCVG
jgi:hypothetical protein